MRVRLISWVSAAGLVLAVSATAQAQRNTLTPCKDGTTSTATGRGVCSGHGGVDGRKLAAQNRAAEIERARAKKAEKTAMRAEKAQKADARADRKVEKREERAEVAMVKCTDGTMSKGGRGACSHHGGIARVVRK